MCHVADMMSFPVKYEPDYCLCVFRYFMVLVQEMAVKMDQGFLGEILAFFTPTANVQADKQKVLVES